MRILHTADLHLDAPGGRRWEALDVLLDTAHRLRADAMVISGDLFDRAPDVDRLKAAFRERAAGASVPLVVIPGNHDAKGLRAGDFLGERVTVLADPSETVDVGDVRICAVPFEPVGTEAVQERLAAVRGRRRQGGTNVLLYHGELLDLVPTTADLGGEVDSVGYMPVHLHAFADSGFDFVLAGHFHRRFFSRAFGGGYFVYPGSPVSITRKETGVRHAALIEPGRPPEAVPLKTHYAEKIDVWLDPFDGSDPLTVVEKTTAAIPEFALADVAIGGFVNLSERGLTESEFAAAIAERTHSSRVAEVSNAWRDVGVVLSHELFRRFETELSRLDLRPADRESARRTAIDALMEVIRAH